MEEEVIKIKESRAVKRLIFFTTVDANASQMATAIADKQTPPPGGEVDPNAENLSAVNVNIWDFISKRGSEAYAIKGNNNEIVEILDIIDGAFCRRKPLTNIYELIGEDELPNVVKGKKYEQNSRGTFSYPLNSIEEFISQAVLYSGESAYSNVFQIDSSEADYNVDISIFRSIDTLDTLSVKNNPLSTYPTQSSETGIVTGTLLARQKVLDENGEKVLIPLANVPVVVFNASETFPTVASTDEDGNRVTLNLLENSRPEDYADRDSYVVEVGKENAEKRLGVELDSRFDGIKPLLKSYQTLDIPEQYKYSTITNEKGEFVLHDIPVGNRLLTFEVDLLKQGMTKDEVALNFFPYSTEEEPNVDSVPHYFFRQIPIGVTPSWGDFQTGYTQVNVTANIDMRRWVTFFVSPIAVEEKNIEELVSTGKLTPLTVLARDMTRDGYPLTSEIVEIQDIFSRDFTQRKEWFNEIKFKKPKIEFRKNNFNAFKLPANLYDPNGKASSDQTRNGVKSSNGVWLCAYEMKMFYPLSSNIYRTTGFVRDKLEGNNTKSANHFDLNRGEGFGVDAATGAAEGSSVNKFPYEKPWTINYPEPYQIPSEPRDANNEINFSSTDVEPRFLDGDMAGLYTQNPDARGYGIMQELEDWSNFIYNKFAQTITKYRIYKYENDVSWHEEYSNGFRKFYHSDLFPNKTFTIKNGEKYQRVEAGFCYWLRPEGWGRIKHEGWGDYMSGRDINPAIASFDSSKPTNRIPRSYYETTYRQGENLLIKMDLTTSPNYLEQGALDIYRVIDDSPENLEEQRPPLKKRYANLFLENVLCNNQKTNQELKLKFGGQKDEVKVCSAAKVDIRNNGTVAANVLVGAVNKKIKPGERVTYDITNGTTIKFESNTNLNIQENFYQTCNYTLDFKTSEILKAGEEKYGFNNFNKTAGISSEAPTFYAISDIENCDGNVKFKGNTIQVSSGDYTSETTIGGNEIKCKNNFTKDSNYAINGIMFARARNSNVTIKFLNNKLTPHCTNGGFGIRRMSAF
jgi:hypothetical protein